jgi:hypothetical protein
MLLERPLPSRPSWYSILISPAIFRQVAPGVRASVSGDEVLDSREIANAFTDADDSSNVGLWDDIADWAWFRSDTLAFTAWFTYRAGWRQFWRIFRRELRDRGKVRNLIQRPEEHRSGAKALIDFVGAFRHG